MGTFALDAKFTFMVFAYKMCLRTQPPCNDTNTATL